MAEIEREVIGPASIRSGSHYVGLEHITSDGTFAAPPMVRQGELASAKFSFTSSHLLYGKLRPYLSKIARPDFDGVCSTDILPVRPGPALSRDYLHHYLRIPSMVALANSRSVGANLPRLSPRVLATFKIPLPPIAEQRRIAEVLDRAETLRAQRRQALAQLDALAESIFREMFGDPVTNPMRWPVSSLGTALRSQQYGPRFYNEQYSEGGTRIVRITDLSENGSLDFASMPRLTVSDSDREKYRLRVGDLIFARTGATVGKAALIRKGDPECIAGAYFISMRFTAAIEPAYALAVLRAPSVRSIVEMRSRQAAQQNLAGRRCGSCRYLLRPLSYRESSFGG